MKYPWNFYFESEEEKEKFIAAIKKKEHENEVMMIRNRSKRYTNYPVFEKKYKPILLLEFKSCQTKQYNQEKNTVNLIDILNDSISRVDVTEVVLGVQETGCTKTVKEKKKRDAV